MKHLGEMFIMRNYNYKKACHERLREYLLENNLSGEWVVHHRDDTPETIAYNAQYYNRWGYNADGSFEYGKYVVFMTKGDHTKYHHTGNRKIGENISKALKGRIGSMTGKKHSLETRAKQSLAARGRKQTPEFMERMQMLREVYHSYRKDGGSIIWNDFQQAFFKNDPSISCIIDKYSS